MALLTAAAGCISDASGDGTAGSFWTGSWLNLATRAGIL